MRHIESRLRDALDKRTSEITTAQHPAPDAGHVVTPPGRGKRRPRLYVLAAAAVALVLAVASWIVIANRQGIPANPAPTVTSATAASSAAESTEATASPEPSMSATPSPTPAPTETPTSHTPGTYPRSAIPWSEVGPGWSYVGVVKGEEMHSVVYLVSRWGAQYSVGTYDARMLDASGDGRTVLLGTDSAVWVVDVSTGTKHTLTAPTRDSLGSASLTRPSGQAVLFVELGAGTPNRLLKINAQTGATELSLGTEIQSAESSPDGRYIVGISAQNFGGSIQILGNATGTLVATVPTPTGTSGCFRENWWSTDQLVVECAVGESRLDVWRYSLSTGAMTRISHSAKAPWGYGVAYPSTVGTVTQQAGSCGPGPIGILSSDGTTDTALTNFPNGGGEASLIAVVGSTAFIVLGGCGDPTVPPRSFMAYDLVSGTPVTLVTGTTSTALVGATIVLT